VAKYLAQVSALACVSLAFSAASPSRADVKLRLEISVGYPVTDLAYSPDGSIIAVAVVKGADQGGSPPLDVRLFSSTDGKLIATLKGHKKEASKLAFVPDGRFLISGAEDGECIIWDVKEHRQVASLKGESEQVGYVAVSPDGKQLAICDVKKHVEIWDIASRKRVVDFTTGEGIMCLAFSPKGNLLAGGTENGALRFWDMRKLKKIRESPSDDRHTKMVRALLFTSQGKELLSAGLDGRLTIWRVESNELILPAGEMHLSDTPETVAASADGRVIVFGCNGGLIFYDSSFLKERYTLPGPICLSHIAYETDDYIMATKFHPKKNELIIGGGDGKVKVWSDPPTFKK